MTQPATFILVAVLVFFTVVSGIRQVDRRLIERVLTLGETAGPWCVFTGAVVGEFVAASRGLGYLLSFAQSTYNSALMVALILLILVVVLLIFGIAGRLERYLLRWN